MLNRKIKQFKNKYIHLDQKLRARENYLVLQQKFKNLFLVHLDVNFVKGWRSIIR